MKSLQIVIVGNGIFDIAVASSANVIISGEMDHLLQQPNKKPAHIIIDVDTDIIQHNRSDQCLRLSQK